MALFDPEHRVDVEAADAAAIAHRFLTRCRTWALEKEIPKRLQRTSESLDPAEAARLHEWVAWVAFVDHALGEVESGKLDPWFAEDAAR
jgi:hypothetical protein